VIYIPVIFDVLRRLYPAREPMGAEVTHLPVPELQKFMDDLNRGITDPDKMNTPCCVQVSHALNLAGQTIPENHPGPRPLRGEKPRANSPIKIGNQTYFYVLAVDELESWLTWKYGAGIDVRAYAGLPSGSTDWAKMQQSLASIKGIVLFRGSGAGKHTELWDGYHIVQTDISNKVWLEPRVLFWCCDFQW
jgi:hypothetical protein